MSAESRRSTALVVDDEPEVRSLIAEYLGTQGFDVIEATNGLEALLHVKRVRPKVVVLDVAMPRLGGVEALKRIRAFDASVRAIVVSGHADEEVRREALGLGAHAILAKPLDLTELGRAVRGETLGTGTDHDVAGRARDQAPEPHTMVAGRVIVVDDDPEMRETLREFLVIKGYRTRTASDGLSAVRAILEEPPDVVLLDIAMPGLTGADALPAIRAVAPGAKVIMVSGTDDVAVAKRTLELGAFDYVMKPVDLAHLAEAIAAAVMMKHVED